MHIYLYKYVDDVSIGKQLRDMYIGGRITNEAELVTDLSKRTLKNHIQIVTVTSMEAYSEYKPYTILPTKGDFVKQVLKM